MHKKISLLGSKKISLPWLSIPCILEKPDPAEAYHAPCNLTCRDLITYCSSLHIPHLIPPSPATLTSFCSSSTPCMLQSSAIGTANHSQHLPAPNILQNLFFIVSLSVSLTFVSLHKGKVFL